MFAFLLYFITGLTSALPIWATLQLAFWGAPTSLLQCTGLAGALAMLAASYMSLFRLQRAAIVGLVAAFGLWSYYLPASIAFVATGPHALSVLSMPPLLLTATLAYSAIALLFLRKTMSQPTLSAIFPPTSGKIAKLSALVATPIFCGFAFLLLPTTQPPRHVWGPNQESDLIVYFEQAATNDEINEFLRTVTGIPKPEQDPTAHDLLPEIAGISAIAPVDSHRGYAIDLWSDVSVSTREQLTAKLRQSPIVYAVLENIVPDEVQELPTPASRLFCPASTGTPSPLEWLPPYCVL